MDNWDVAREFVSNNNILDGQASGRNFFFLGDTLYSYGTHYPLAIKLFDAEKVEFITNATDSSKTTVRHHSEFRNAALGYTKWHTPDCDINKIHDYIMDTMASCMENIAKAKAKGALVHYLEQAAALIKYYAKFCARFRLRPKYAPVFASMSKKCKTRMRKGCSYIGNSNWKLYREYTAIMEVTLALTRVV